MQCPVCGYLLDHLDTECLRCQVLRAKGIDPSTARSDSQAEAEDPPSTASAQRIAPMSTDTSRVSYSTAQPARKGMTTTAKMLTFFGIVFGIILTRFVAVIGTINHADNPPPPPPSAATLTGGDTALFAKAQALAAAHSSPTGVVWSLEDCAQLVQDKVTFGMWFDEVEYVYGMPDKDNSDESSSGTRDQFVYGGDGEYDYLYFENSKLTSISDNGHVFQFVLAYKKKTGHTGDDERIVMQAELDAIEVKHQQDIADLDAKSKKFDADLDAKNKKFDADQKARSDAYQRWINGDTSAKRDVDYYDRQISDDMH